MTTPIAQGPVDVNVRGAVTLEQLRKISQTLSKNAVKPFRVKNSAVAKAMTDNDPTGHVWQVGEEYYRLEYSDGTHEFQHT